MSVKFQLFRSDFLISCKRKREDYLARSFSGFKLDAFNKREGKLIYSDINIEIMKC